MDHYQTNEFLTFPFFFVVEIVQSIIISTIYVCPIEKKKNWVVCHLKGSKIAIKCNYECLNMKSMKSLTCNKPLNADV